MKLFENITFYLGLLMSIVLISWFFIDLYKNRKNKKALIKTGIRLFILSAIVLLPIKFIESDFGQRLGQDFRVEYHSTISSEKVDSIDFSNQYFEVISFKHYIEYRTRHVNRPISDFANEKWSRSIIKKFSELKKSTDSLSHDIGYLFTAFHYANLKLDPLKVSLELDQLYDTLIPYYNYIKGVNEFNRHSWNHLNKSEYHLLKSIELNECSSDSYENLARLYFYFSQNEKLNALIDNPETTGYVPEYAKRARYLNEFNWLEYWKVRLESEFSYWHIMGVSSAIILLMLWLHYLRKLDIYEPEKRRFLLLTFIISIISMQLIYPTHDVMWHVFDYHRPWTPISDLWYCVISIGMVEELVKIIPVLIMLRFSKQINEPFDYILYPAVAALGFAFIENIGYFGENIGNVSIRGIYCCVIHVAFSATIGYGLMLAKYRGYNKYLMFSVFFVLASFLHGFYDFWIIDWWATQYNWVSDLTFLLCIYLLGYYINNTLNNSTFFKHEIKLESAKLRFLVIAICTAVLMTGYVTMSIAFKADFAYKSLFQSAIKFNFYICFIALSMGSIKLINGYVSPLTLPLRNLFKVKRELEDLSGNFLQLAASKKFKLEKVLIGDTQVLNQEVELMKRLIVNDYLNSYLIKLTNPLQIEGYENSVLLAIPHWDKGSFRSRNKTLTNVYLIKDKSDLEKPFLKEEDFKYLGKLFAKRST